MEEVWAVEEEEEAGIEEVVWCGALTYLGETRRGRNTNINNKTENILPPKKKKRDTLSKLKIRHTRSELKEERKDKIRCFIPICSSGGHLETLFLSFYRLCVYFTSCLSRLKSGVIATSHLRILLSLQDHNNNNTLP